MIWGGAATIGMPIGPTWQTIRIQPVKAPEFVKKFNDLTEEWPKILFTVNILIYKNGDFDFIIRAPDTTYLIDQFKKVISSGTTVSEEDEEEDMNKKASITRTDLYNIAKLKCCFNYNLIKPIYLMLLNKVAQMNIELIDE